MAHISMHKYIQANATNVLEASKQFINVQGNDRVYQNILTSGAYA